MQLDGVLVSNSDQCASWCGPILGSRPSAFGTGRGSTVQGERMINHLKGGPPDLKYAHHS